jgi:hypothetical protein
MKTAITLLAMLYSTVACSHATKEEADFMIIFGGCFERDVISMKINNVAVFNQYKIGDEQKGGNLSLKQYANIIDIFYNGQKKSKPGIDLNFYLNLEIKINQKVAMFRLDLRKGKVVVLERCGVSSNDKEVKKLKAEQLSEPLLFL